MKPLHCIDFETKEIVGNPTVRPPLPVGFALKRPGFKSRYFRWGHPSGNNCTFEEARTRLLSIVQSSDEVLFYNAKYDLSVMRHMDVGVEKIDHMRVHDAMFSVFLHDPYAMSLGLKPSSERILGWDPDEQDDLQRWILAHISGATHLNWGAYIGYAPGDIVEPYARGDVDRTLALHLELHPKVPREPYDRERKLLPILIASERRGVRIDQEKLEADMAEYEKALDKCSSRIYKLLKNTEVNLDSGPELAAAVDSAGLAGEWVLTPTGKRSTARDNLMSAIAHPELLGLLVYRGALSHCLSNFGRPWISITRDYNGRMHPDWSQVRQPRTDNSDTKGTRTGRLSGMKPNFQNMPNEYTIDIPKGYPNLPLMRQYLLPDKGYVWLKRDYSQQELRILAHFSEGRLYERYQENPRIDAHVETGELVKLHAGIELPRKDIKITGFSIIYGAGLTKLGQQLGRPYHEAQTTRNAYFTALPEVPKLMKECSSTGARGEAITTWGGRIYFSEPPRMDKKTKRMMEFHYKLLNYLIQGSAGDCTKESIVRHDADKGTGEFLITVHDENNIQAPKSEAKPAMAKLKKAMESIEFDVQMLSDGFQGKNWAALKECA